MTRLPLRATPLAALLLALLATALTPAAPAAPVEDPWTRWVTPLDVQRDAWARSLDFVGPKLFAGTEDDGIFTSSNALGPWALANGGLDTVNKRQIRQVVSKDTTLYAATSGGLFKSGSGAISWTQLGTGAPPRRLMMGGIQTVHVNSATDLVVGTASFGIYYSSDSGDHWDKATGLPANESIFYIVASPTVPTRLYAAGMDGVFVSTNSGRSWALSSDGLPFANVLRLAVSPLNPTVLYAATTSGLYRSANAALSWKPVNGAGATALLGSQVRAIFLAPAEFGGGGRLVVGTEKGVWATKDSGATWGQMGTGALLNEPPMGGQIVWALGIGFTPPALLAGTKANGVYSHTLLPILADVSPGITPKTGVKVGTTLTSGPGLWKGSRPYFLAYQWKRCSSTGTNCVAITGAKGTTYSVQAADVGKKIKVTVTASNIVAPAAVSRTSTGVPSSGTVGAAPAVAPIPMSGAGPSLTPRDASYPWGQVYTIAPGSWQVNGAKVTPTFKYAWRRCTPAGACTTLTGQTAKTYTSVAADAGNKLEGHVTATFNGASTTRLAGQSNQVIEKTPVNTSLPRIIGTPNVGNTLSSTVGAWTATTPTFERRWLACESDGTGCNPIFGATAATYKPTAQFIGKRLKLEVKAITPDVQNRIAYAFSLPTAAVK